jgi:hypothetical protein
MSRYGFYAALTLLGLVIGLAVPARANKAADCASVSACRALAPDKAGPALLRFLQDENWDSRVEAAFALGGIEYKPSVPELVTALANESDWQLVYMAVVSLSRLQDPSALKPLQEAASSYWHPAVRKAAECAVQFVESGKPCDRYDEILDIDLSGLHTIRMGAGKCSSDKKPYAVKETTAMKQYGNEQAMQKFKYTGTECDLLGEVDKKTGTRPCLAQRFLYPKIAARTVDGWLTGRDEGAFAGELMFFPDKGEPYEILRANVEDIYVLENGATIALTGLSNTTINSGMAYSLRQGGPGKWQVEPLLRLHGAPESSYKVSSEEIIVNAAGEMIVFDAQGNPEIAFCGKRAYKKK